MTPGRRVPPPRAQHRSPRTAHAGSDRRVPAPRPAGGGQGGERIATGTIPRDASCRGASRAATAPAPRRSDRARGRPRARAAGTCRDGMADRAAHGASAGRIPGAAAQWTFTRAGDPL
ncbi:hypothetical protein GCM10010964_36370 [Caldovatus sediminis]|uniref:Uncharacterized protein n=1 Tax=Caldovatus sediminis TaxID=2041189 RepID=A0A8J3EEU4_9PROT|nr:hypothetical protein GCM10010964_36370 [Caldovatus sediminis]